MDELELALYWTEIPVGRKKAITYCDLMRMWGKSERAVRQILHELSRFDNGDNYILIRSSKGKGFYRTDDAEEIEKYKKECLNKGKSVFAPVKKINRVLMSNSSQFSIENNLKVVRVMKGKTQTEVVKFLREYGAPFDNSLLSKMENGICLPDPYTLRLLAKFYDCEPSELLNADLFF